MITSGFGFQLDIESGEMRRWYQKKDDVKRWFDNDSPVDKSEATAVSDITEIDKSDSN